MIVSCSFIIGRIESNEFIRMFTFNRLLFTSTNTEMPDFYRNGLLKKRCFIDIGNTSCLILIFMLSLYKLIADIKRSQKYKFRCGELPSYVSKSLHILHILFLFHRQQC